MENIRFDFSNFHRYGPAFIDYLGLRKQVFVDQLKWDVPHDDQVEMDQYDTPVAHYSLVVRDGKVIGGARTMATSSVWGSHTYMLRDAFSGKLPHIPRDVMSVEIASPEVWECTRLVISDELTLHSERAECLTLIVDGLVEMARAKGAKTLISLSPLPFMRAMRQLGYGVTLLGEPYRSGEDGRQYGVLRMPAEYSTVRQMQMERLAPAMPVVSKRRQTVEPMPGAMRPAAMLEALA